MTKVRSILSSCKDILINSRGFHTKRKLLIIESDDWGSIRTPSNLVLKRLIAMGDTADKDAFLSNDSIEREEDLVLLFDMLKKFRDSKDKHPCVTANFAVANPDFDKIDIEKGKYNYEPFFYTYNKFGEDSNKILNVIKDGINEHIFYPQLHTLEHMNVIRWMKDLRAKNKNTLLAFENKMIGVGASFSEDNWFGYMDALNYDNEIELKQLEVRLREAARIFKETFGYDSRTFVASCFVWTEQIEKILCKIGVDSIQTQCWQNICVEDGTRNMKRKLHYTGQKNSCGQIYTVRNCEYEPGYDHNQSRSVQKCLEEIDTAFKNHKPAIINSHRMNYIGSINKENAEIGRNGLKQILEEVCKKYPDIEFVTTEELLDIIKEGK